MSDKTWKAEERKVAGEFGVRRNPNNGENREDISAGGLSIQVKHGAQVPKFIENTMAQARRDCHDGCVPVAAFHRKGSSRRYATLTVGELAKVSPDMIVCVEVGDLARLVSENDITETVTDENMEQKDSLRDVG
ncbi:MAG: hypothetical protein ACYC27_10310 [Armatimonadota bacterium]